MDDRHYLLRRCSLPLHSLSRAVPCWSILSMEPSLIICKIYIPARHVKSDWNARYYRVAWTGEIGRVKCSPYTVQVR